MLRRERIVNGAGKVTHLGRSKSVPPGQVSRCVPVDPSPLRGSERPVPEPIGP